MLNYKLLRQLAPLHYRDERLKETQQEYLGRMADVVPNIPPDVLEQWLFRHWRGFESNWSWLDLSQVSFRQEVWSTERVFRQIDSLCMDLILGLSERLKSNRYVQSSWLGHFMLEEGTWPNPIIVLQNTDNLRNPYGKILRPFNLLEGHHRLAYFIAMKQLSHQALQHEHTVWLARSHFVDKKMGY